MSDRDLKRDLDQTQLGVAALGLCIARVFAESDPTIRQRILEEAEKMERHLAQHDRLAAVQVMSHFRLALANPGKMPLLTPDS